LPRFKSGDYLFSVGRGTPANNFSKIKHALDQLMIEELRKTDPNAKLPPFVLHNLRRTMRTRVSSLRIPDTVAEMVIGHGRKGLQRVYDQHKFIDEMREALQRWSDHVGQIVRSKPTSLTLRRVERTDA